MLAPPVVHERFTPLPCSAHATTTLAMEGCAEQRVLRGDRRIDALAATAFRLVHGVDNRAAFVAGERAWLRYRNASCTAEASKDDGGTLQPVAYGTCLAARNRTHAADLSALVRVLRFH
jgi:uncharacterized protein YecT (DUF1311 family)